MGKRAYIILAALATALVGVLFWQVLSREPEPLFKGKPLSRWLIAYRTGSQTTFARTTADEAYAAVRTTGTNAIPTLLRLLRANDSLLKVSMMRLTQKQHIITINYIRAGDWNQAGLDGFQFLGAEAQSAVPALIEILNQSVSPESQYCTIGALSCAGPRAKEAVPSLFRCATNADNAYIYITARNALGNLDPKAAAKAGVINSLR
jgi:hypothetical protein